MVALEAKYLNIHPAMGGTFPLHVGRHERKIATKSGKVQGADLKTGSVGAGVFYYAESLPNCLVWHVDRIGMKGLRFVPCLCSLIVTGGTRV